MFVLNDTLHCDLLRQVKAEGGDKRVSVRGPASLEDEEVSETFRLTRD
jgi:hypothetical protein